MSNTSVQTSASQSEKTRTVIMAALMAALTCVGTMIIRIPTPTMGYIHPGDGFVLLSGLLLGPVWGALAAGIGSALTDLIGGYFIYVPATLIIKALTALTGWALFTAIKKVTGEGKLIPALIISGIVGELVMVAGYFLYEIFLLADGSLAAGILASAAGIPANLIQGVFGVVISTILFPLLNRLAK